MTETPLRDNLPGANRAWKLVAFLSLALGVLALALGAVSWFHGASLRRAAAESTEVPVTLQAGQSLQVLFRTAGRHKLQVFLVLRRHEGVSDAALDEALHGAKGPPDITWEVSQNEARLAWGNSRLAAHGGFSTQDRRALCVGEFKPAGGGSFQFKARVNQATPGLQAARPVLEIRPHIAEVKSAGIASAIYRTLGIILLCIGGVAELVSVLLLRKRP